MVEVCRRLGRIDGVGWAGKGGLVGGWGYIEGAGRRKGVVDKYLSEINGIEGAIYSMKAVLEIWKKDS